MIALCSVLQNVGALFMKQMRLGVGLQLHQGDVTGQLQGCLISAFYIIPYTLSVAWILC